MNDTQHCRPIEEQDMKTAREILFTIALPKRASFWHRACARVSITLKFTDDSEGVVMRDIPVLEGDNLTQTIKFLMPAQSEFKQLERRKGDRRKTPDAVK